MRYWIGLSVLFFVLFPVSLSAAQNDIDCRSWGGGDPNCPDRGGCGCPSPVELTVSSSTEVVNIGTVFTASGGRAPYAISFDEGGLEVLTEDAAAARVTSLSNCSVPGTLRTGKVTVTDACGVSASRTVRLTGGYLQLIHTNWGDSSFFNFYTDPNGSCTYGTVEEPCNEYQDKEENGRIFRDGWINVKWRSGGPCNATCNNSPNTEFVEPTSCSPQTMCVQHQEIYEWRCP